MLKKYRFTGIKDGYFNASTTISSEGFSGIPGDTIIIYAEVVLDKIPEASTPGTTAEIKLKNIYYDFNDTTLRPESFPELDKLVKLLNENPSLIIQINSHTDARGTEKYNEKLSQGRANSVVQYLIVKGIVTERLVAKGYGESSPDVVRKEEILPGGKVVPKNTKLAEPFINQYRSKKDDFEFLHQLNRRTTFTILSC